jgi:hypothetical protein
MLVGWAAPPEAGAVVVAGATLPHAASRGRETAKPARPRPVLKN